MRANIKFCMELGKTPTETFKMMQRTPSNSSVKRALVFKWYKRFADGRDSLEDDEGRGRKTKISSDVVASVREALDSDRRLTVRTLSAMIGVSVGTIYTILTEHLKMSKVHARWVPRLLKDSEKERRVKDSKTFIKRYEKDGNDFLNRIITTDETWLWFYDPETKSQLEIDVLGFGRIDHPPYSPDLAPFDFAIFPEIKSQLKGRRFSSLSELRSATANIISQYNQDWYRDIFDKWVRRHRKCVAYDGEYFEKK